MKLQLKYQQKNKQNIAAVFVRGDNINVWLNTIKKLDISIAQLACYAIPVSIQINNVSGLFIILPTGSKVPDELLLEQYVKFGDKLFIPYNSILYPAIESAELNSLLLWDLQVFHASIGLIGFEEKDRINFIDLIQDPALNSNDWSFANPGLPQRPAFTKVLVQQQAADEVIESFKEAINPKPLEEIPKEFNSNFLSKTFDAIGLLLFKALLSLTGLPVALFNLKNNSALSKPGSTGLMNEFRQWLQENITDLEKKRSSELNRLLRMFDENTDEALQYAIPLNSPYLNRGSARKTSSLAKRSLNFDLRKLGGGYAVDGWNIDDHYSSLRTKYLQAAEKEIKANDFRKAAYVYAHLLADFSAAANVLEQGKFYREAAAIHKDHFKNKKAAAQCFERGELYNEAITIYEELEENEKTGDLFSLLKQQTNANDFYQKALDRKVDSNDYLDAARIAKEKMNDTFKAQNLLFNGWNSYQQSEECLEGYFELVINTDKDQVQSSVHEIYNYHTPASKRLQFLNVLGKINQSTGSTNNSFTEIAYEIVSDEASNGNMLPLYNLKQFLQKDQLISSDCSRYINSNKLKNTRVTSNQLLHLEPSIKWFKAITHRNQFIALGVKESLLHMARVNWYGNIEYYTWTISLKSTTRLSFTLSQFYSKHIILQASGDYYVSNKTLAKNKYFNDALSVHCPVWLHKDQGQFVINENEELCKLEIKSDAITIHYYSIHGDLKKSINCKSDKNTELGSYLSNPITVTLNGCFYTYRDKKFITISDKGFVNVVSFETVIRTFTASNEFSKLYIIISTNKGCVLCKPKNEKLNIVSDYFATNLIPSSILFIAECKFLMLEKKKAILFFIDDNNNVDVIKEFYTEDLIVGALPHNRNEFGLLEQNGRITLFTTE